MANGAGSTRFPSTSSDARHTQAREKVSAILSNLNQQLKQLRHMALDLDGTLYCGQTVFDGTARFLETLDELQLGRTFLTNNSSSSTEQYHTKLAAFGITARAEDIYTSTDATIELLGERFPEVRRLFVLGTPSLQQQLSKVGFEMCADCANDEPDAVVIGYDSSLDYARLCRAAYWVAQGKTYLATNPDRVCPTDQPTVLVDCGSICAAVQHATGRQPDAVAGKPDRRMLSNLLRRHDLADNELAMVGDRIYTDMAMAREAGVMSVLVLSGEATQEDLQDCDCPPDVVVQGVAELADLLKECRVDD